MSDDAKSTPAHVSPTLVQRLAERTAEVMNLANMLRRGDDASWAGIGDNARTMVTTELMAFADDVREMTAHRADEELALSAECARALAQEVLLHGLPATENAMALSSALLTALGVPAHVLDAVDG